MKDLQHTQQFTNLDKLPVSEARETILSVFLALKEKGYNPVNQIVGYILSGDPTYITSHNDARILISRLERDELLEEILIDYLENSGL
ncbi:MAG: IreB family regulatory phosphoprotein [Defluviitaleaceae bacterium]|nr:IreB family regulatory phosphoprotein [Defluviitaleaceae bacterium]